MRVHYTNEYGLRIGFENWVWNPKIKLMRVALRDGGWFCHYCYVPLASCFQELIAGVWMPHLDHKIPDALGGSSKLSNRVLACSKCNIKKSHRHSYEKFFEMTTHLRMKPPLNFTPIPDALIDRFMPYMTGAELKVVLYIARRTYGFNKKKDWISLGQLEKGILTQEGKRLDSGTGLCRTSIIAAIRTLERRRVIVKETSDKQTSFFSLNFDYPASPIFGQTSPIFELEGVQKLNPQYTVVQETDLQEAVAKKKQNQNLGHKEQPKKENSEKERKVMELKKGKIKTVAADVVKALQAPNKGINLSALNFKTSTLIKWWQALVPLHHDVNFQKQFTAKQAGQMKQYAAIAGTEAGLVLYWVIENWKEFTDRLRVAYDIKTWPKVPEIGFLLVYADSAVDMYRKSLIKEVPTPTVVKALVEKSKIKKDKKLTQDDFFKLMGK